MKGVGCCCGTARRPKTSGDTTPCRMTGVTSHGAVSPETSALLLLLLLLFHVPHERSSE